MAEQKQLLCKPVDISVHLEAMNKIGFVPKRDSYYPGYLEFDQGHHLVIHCFNSAKFDEKFHNLFLSKKQESEFPSTFNLVNLIVSLDYTSNREILVKLYENYAEFLRTRWIWVVNRVNYSVKFVPLPAETIHKILNELQEDNADEDNADEDNADEDNADEDNADEDNADERDQVDEQSNVLDTHVLHKPLSQDVTDVKSELSYHDSGEDDNCENESDNSGLAGVYERNR